MKPNLTKQNEPRIIPLSNGFKAIVDEADFERVNKLTWFAKKTGTDDRIVYAAHSQKINGKVFTIYMHRFIMDCPTNMSVDHGDENRLNNSQSNLEIVSLQENTKRRWK